MTHRAPERPDKAAIGFAYLAAVGLLGCQTPPYCSELGKCGGDVLRGSPTADWIVMGPDTCMDQVESPQRPVSAVRQPAKPSGERPLERTGLDWCASIVLKQDGSIQQFHGIDVPLLSNNFWFPSVPIWDGALKFSGNGANGTYTSRLTQWAPQRAELSASCLEAQGVARNCPALGRHLREFVSGQLKMYPEVVLDLQYLRCYDDGRAGCSCDYDLTLTSSPAGPWFAKGNTLTLFDAAFKPPSPADYCVGGNTLELTGQNEGRLFNDANVRTLRYRLSTCDDGVKGQSEEGIDCGGACPSPCPKCDDAMKNGDETGVDCGGSCPEMCACSDNVQNPWEEGVDCGGPCAAPCPPPMP